MSEESQRNLRVRWYDSLGEGGPSPMKIMAKWFMLNRTNYHREANKYVALEGLRATLSTEGANFNAKEIFDKLESLRKELYDFTLQQSVWGELSPYKHRLLYCLFNDDEHRENLAEREKAAKREHEAENGRSVRERVEPAEHEVTPRRVPRLRWFDPSSGMENPIDLLVSWLDDNHEAYLRCPTGEREELLKPLYEKMVATGHHHCSTSRIAKMTSEMLRESKKSSKARAYHRRSKCFERHYNFFMNLFAKSTGVHGTEAMKFDGDETQDELVPETSERDFELPIPQNANNHHQGRSSVNQHTMSPNRNDTQPNNNVGPGIPLGGGADPAVNYKRSWLVRSRTGGSSKMELLVAWLAKNYKAKYAKQSQLGVKKLVLMELLEEIKTAGHEGCEVDHIRSKIDSLVREAHGLKSPSQAFTSYANVLNQALTFRPPVSSGTLIIQPTPY